MLAKLDNCFSNRVENAKYLRNHHLNKGFVSVGSLANQKLSNESGRPELSTPRRQLSKRPKVSSLARYAWAFQK